MGAGYLEYYLKYFGEATHRLVEIIPASEERVHVELSLGGIADPSHVKNIKTQEQEREQEQEQERETKEISHHAHPCWCNPELIYCDEEKGNEVWLHKRIQ